MIPHYAFFRPFINIGASQNDEYQINLDVEEQRGGYIVAPFVHEEVNGKWVNGVAFVKPVSLDELKEGVNACQLVNSKRVEFTAPSVDPIFVNKMVNWKEKMEVHQKAQKTRKLTETISTFAVDAKTLPPRKIFFEIGNEDVLMSNEHFTDPSKGDKHVDFIMVPYEYKSRLGAKRYETAECLLVWRVSFVGTDRPVGDPNSTSQQKKSAIDELVDLMAGNTI